MGSVATCRTIGDVHPDRLADVGAALRGLGLPANADVAPAAAGASGSAWRVRVEGATWVMRLAGSAAMADSRLTAMAAARDAGLPAPDLLRRTSTADGEVILLSWLPGVPLLDVLTRVPAQSRRYGERMGRLQRRLHRIAAPPKVVRAADDAGHPFGAGRGVPSLPDGDRLLHLDWHPLNLLVDEAVGEITGIVDWDNARAGDPSLDLARTRAILSLEPGLADHPEGVRDRLPELLEAWADGYGPQARAIPRAADAWAGRVMLTDLAPRYAGRPEALDPIRRWTEAAGG